MERRKESVGLTFEPLSPERWKDFEDLFGERGACGGCWCMYWRLPRKTFESQKGAGNRLAMKRLVFRGEAPGILVYCDGQAVGWCSVAPRESFPALGRSRILKPLDAKPVWSVACLFVAKPFRRKGVTVALLKAAADYVADRGGQILEGYPIEPETDSLPDVFAWTGLASAFRRAGFKECARRSDTRPIMRRRIKRKT